MAVYFPKGYPDGSCLSPFLRNVGYYPRYVLEGHDFARYTVGNQVDIDIYDKDAEVNRFEREVRRDVFNHLV